MQSRDPPLAARWRGVLPGQLKIAIGLITPQKQKIKTHNQIQSFKPIFDRSFTHIHQLKHKQELHCLIEYVHIQTASDEPPSAMALHLFHL